MTYLPGDHLGSASLATTAAGAQVSAQRYLPYGAPRADFAASAMPTDRQFTGQRHETTLGFYDYNARQYDPVLGRFLQADSIVPAPGNPQSLNRYAYTLNNPLRYTDPSGHNPIDDEWEQNFYAAHGRKPNDQDRHDRFFSILFPGSGPNGSWTDADWARYSSDRQRFWNGTRLWPGAQPPGLDRFIAHLERLASYYKAGEETFYARAVGFIWGGIPLVDDLTAAWQMGTNPGAAWAKYTPLFEGTANWQPGLVDDENPSHHYAGLFYAGYFYGFAGHVANWLRDGPLSDRSVPDLNLGYLAVNHGCMLFDGVINMSEVGIAARYAVDTRSGIWPINTPGRRTPWYYPQPWAR